MFENGARESGIAKNRIGKFHSELADSGGSEEIRALDPYNANQPQELFQALEAVFYQLSFIHLSSHCFHVVRGSV